MKSDIAIHQRRLKVNQRCVGRRIITITRHRPSFATRWVDRRIMDMIRADLPFTTWEIESQIVSDYKDEV